MLGSPLDQLLASVDPAGCHLHPLPDRIWIFGGMVESGVHMPYCSLRDSFLSQTLELPPSANTSWVAKIDIPENHKDWFAFSGYDDLLQFERDACYLAQAIVLFAESPGSLAELGALAIDDSLIQNLVVVAQTHYFDPENRNSFLNLGPLKRVRDKDHLCVIGASKGSKELTGDDLQTIVESVHNWLPPLQKIVAFHPLNPTHRLLLVADLVDMFLVAKSVEIREACAHFGIIYSDTELLKALNLLDFFGMLKIESRGLEKFYVRRSKSGAPWVNYKSSGTSPFDRSRFKTESSARIKLDLRRHSILERAS